MFCFFRFGCFLIRFRFCLLLISAFVDRRLVSVCCTVVAFVFCEAGVSSELGFIVNFLGC